MNINKFSKLLIIISLFIISAIQTYADSPVFLLKKITVTSDNYNEYKLNLYFNDKFTESAFFQKQTDGLYYVFIPDATYGNKNIKIRYKVPEDMKDIRIEADTKPYIKKNTESKYIRLAVYMDDSCSLTLRTDIDRNNSIIPDEITGILIILGILTVCLRFSRIFGFSKKQEQYNRTTVLPGDLKRRSRAVRYSDMRSRNIINREIIENSFKSFEIQGENIPLYSPADLIPPKPDKKKSQVKVNKKSKLTVPITSGNKNIHDNEEKEFSMPYVDGETHEKNKEGNLPAITVSTLELTPSKGFSLKQSADSYFLYSYSDEQHHLIREFKNLRQYNIQARFYDQDQNNDIYIVRLDDYKAMIEFSKTGIRELSVL